MRERNWMGRFRGERMERDNSEVGRPRDASRNIVGTPKLPITNFGLSGEASLKRVGRR